MRPTLLSLSLVSLALTLSACSTHKQNIQPVQPTPPIAQKTYQSTKPFILRTSETDNRPSWTKELFSESKDGMNVRFTGAFLGGADYPLTVRMAYAEALKNASSTIKQYVRAEFSEFVQGNNRDRVDRWVSDGIASIVPNLLMQGLTQKKVYYEEMYSPSSMTPRWNVWVQAEMPMQDYLRAKAQAVDSLRKEFEREGQMEAKRKAEDLLSRLRRDIDSIDSMQPPQPTHTAYMEDPYVRILPSMTKEENNAINRDIQAQHPQEKVLVEPEPGYPVEEEFLPIE